MKTESPIMVVDDEAFMRRALAFVLRREGYSVILAEDGLTALDKVRDLLPRMIFLDVMMPGIDGYEVCRRVKENPLTRGTHIVLLTARGEEIDQGVGLAAGADEYMTKPFSPSVILARVRDVVGWPEESLAPGS